MQFVLSTILIGALAAGVIVLAVMGVRQGLRRRRLAGAAHGTGMLFSISDPFDLPRRHRGFLLFSGGHSPIAENVMYGRRGGLNVRVFDFTFEAGHGPSRLSRRYGVISTETDLNLPEVLLWPFGDTEHAPLLVRQATERAMDWLVVAGRAWAGMVAEAFAELAGEPVGIEIAGGVVVVCRAGGWPAGSILDETDKVVQAVDKLRRRLAAEAA